MLFDTQGFAQLLANFRAKCAKGVRQCKMITFRHSAALILVFACLYCSTETQFRVRRDGGTSSFTFNDQDVIVFLHIQKTAGTYFGRNLVRNLDVPYKCVHTRKLKTSKCHKSSTNNETWLFSRYSTGWKCTLHADWTILQKCVPIKMRQMFGAEKTYRYFYMTGLREPGRRFLSEWKHVRRGATWKTSKYICNETITQIPRCYKGENWRGVSLDEFLSCERNMAFNRQTRMIADLSKVRCYDMWSDKPISDDDKQRLKNQMLESAKQNLLVKYCGVCASEIIGVQHHIYDYVLKGTFSFYVTLNTTLSTVGNIAKRMPFFYIVEKMIPSQLLFEDVFGFNFINDFIQQESRRSSMEGLPQSVIRRIEEANDLDIQLYAYAVDLFNQRFDAYRQRQKMNAQT